MPSQQVFGCLGSQGLIIQMQTPWVSKWSFLYHQELEDDETEEEPPPEPDRQDALAKIFHQPRCNPETTGH